MKKITIKFKTPITPKAQDVPPSIPTQCGYLSMSDLLKSFNDPLVPKLTDTSTLISTAKQTVAPQPKPDTPTQSDNQPQYTSSELLKPISDEQKQIVDSISKGYNVSVSAISGSGKTTTSLYVSLNNLNRSILLLTYNAKLKIETRVKVTDLNITNMEIHSYHSFCVKYLYRKAFTDTGIRAFIKSNNISSVLKPFKYDLIIIDESQDMNPLYYEIVQHIMARHEVPPQLIVMGDEKQSIYAFNNADSRFLTLSEQIFDQSHAWVNHNLSTSYRLTDQMAQFLNTCCIGAPYINTIKNGPKVRYMICNTFDDKPLNEIRQCLRMGYRNDDIFVLTASVKSEKSPVRQLANKLTDEGVAIYVPTSDEEKLDEEVLGGKIVFSTFHQAKGLERKVVMVYNFDQSYFTFYDKVSPQGVIPNTIYVAITRAKERLIIIHDDQSSFFDFIRRPNLAGCCDMDVSKRFRPNAVDKNVRSPPPNKINVTDLVKYVPIDVIEQCMSYVTVTQSGKDDILGIASKSKQKELYENVSEITGTALPSYYEYTISGKMTIYEHLKCNRKCMLDDSNEELFEQIGQESGDILCGNLLQLATNYISEVSGYDFKKKQITQYDWLSESLLEQSNDRLDKIFAESQRKHLQFEKPVSAMCLTQTIVGYVDVYNPQSRELWELKVVKEIDPTHILQTIVYSWIIQNVSKMVLFNITDGVSHTIKCDEMKAVVDILVKHKISAKLNQSNESFIAKCHEKLIKKING